MIFFGWNQSTLNSKSKETISQARNVLARSNLLIAVYGYTDSSGDVKYNMRLSRRRAETVAAQLEAEGIPKSKLLVRSFGDAFELVRTQPGVREARNRRVEIYTTSIQP
jgi:outer membrane protein OmpA-like peptidoglycan-associated protein